MLGLNPYAGMSQVAPPFPYATPQQTWSGLSVPEVALISGHKTPAMLFRYTHLKAEAVAEKLRLQKT